MQSTQKILLLCLSITLWALPLHAFDSEVKVDGEVIPPVLFDGYAKHRLTRNMNCPPHSDAYVRDRVVLSWLLVQDGKARNLSIGEDTKGYLERVDDELASDKAQSDEEFASTRHWLKLEYLVGNYVGQQIKYPGNKQKMSEYDRRVKEKDPAFVDVPMVKIAKVRTDKESLDAIAKQLRDGESWEQVSANVEEYDWNSYNYEKWLPASSLSDAYNNLFDRLNIDVNSLSAGDVLGPYEAHPIYHLVVILDHEVRPQIMANEKIGSSSEWALTEAGYGLVEQQRIALHTALVEGRTLTENGEPFSPVKDGSFKACPMK